MDESRIDDYIINGGDIDFNYYGQESFTPPPVEDQNKLYNYLLYVAVKYYNFDTNKFYSNKRYSSFIPNDFLKNCSSFEEAELEINKLKDELAKHEFYNTILNENETYKDLYERSFTRIASSIIGGGEKFYSSRLKHHIAEIDIRLYIPCNSEYCYRFAKLIIEKSIEKGLDFEFKVMNVEENKNGADNIVMYMPANDFSKQVNMIIEIIRENPDITFGEPHMFGYPVNKYIAVAPEISGTSYSGYIRDLLKETIPQYGHTELCSKKVYAMVTRTLYKSGIIEGVNDLLNNGIIQNIEDRHI